MISVIAMLAGESVRKARAPNQQKNLLCVPD
jgi:hypothetical protein